MVEDVAVYEDGFSGCDALIESGGMMSEDGKTKSVKSVDGAARPQRVSLKDIADELGIS